VNLSPQTNVAVVGAGILGLAHAYALAKQGRKVTVFERSPKAAGASIRNFGMVWPVGQPAGRMHQLAMRSRALWLEIIDAAQLPHYPTGSLHVAVQEDERTLLEEFASIGPAQGFECSYLDRESVHERSPALQPGVVAGLWSPTEVVVDPRLTLWTLPEFLEERYGVEFRFGTQVTAIDLPRIIAGGATFSFDQVFICSGDDFQTLYPDVLATSGITRCKLQMLRTGPQPDGWQLGPSLAAGLTLQFYKAFEICRTLPALKARIAEEMPAYNRYGIHVLASQTASGEVTLGDSHEYGLDVDIFNKEEIDALILAYLDSFARFPSRSIAQRWYGVYAKHPEKPYCVFDPAPGVRIVTAPGGSGMTLSFGLAEETTK
jgi:FAD dependent oxidoreductase TIGR03364